MKKLPNLIMLFCLLAAPAFASSDKGKADYWLGRYKEVKEGPLHAGAMNVFSKVLVAADRRKGVEPRLHIIDYSGLPWAQSLEDGSIILTKRAVEFCYHDKDKEAGAARLAFVMGHELAHQFNGDFWPYRFVESTGNNPEFSGIKESARSPEVLKAIELEADQYGIIYASMAGFRTDVVVSKDQNFFEEWSRASYTAMTGLSPDNPSVNQRAKAVTARLKEVSSRLEFFRMGVIAYGLGWHKESIGLFEEFLRYYPSREVFNNLGVSYLTLAAKKYREWKGYTAIPFSLSVEIDHATRGESVEVGWNNDGTASKEFRTYLDRAMEYFKKASESDPEYIVARSNLGAAYILDEKYHKALAELEDAARMNANDAGVINNRAIAYFLLGNTLSDDGLKKRAISEWEKAGSGGCRQLYRRNLMTARRITGHPDEALSGAIYEETELNIPEVRFSTKTGKLFSKEGSRHLGEIVLPGDIKISVHVDDNEVVLVKNGVSKIVYTRLTNFEEERRRCDADIVLSKEERKGMDLKNNIIFIYQK